MSLKARIIEGNKLAGVYTDNFLLDRQHDVVNDTLVSEWIMTENLPSAEQLDAYKIGIPILLVDGVWQEQPETEIYEAIRQQKIQEIKAMQKAELSATDWVVTRKFELGIDIPETIQNSRAAIREKYSELITQFGGNDQMKK